MPGSACAAVHGRMQHTWPTLGYLCVESIALLRMHLRGNVARSGFDSPRLILNFLPFEFLTGKSVGLGLQIHCCSFAILHEVSRQSRKLAPKTCSSQYRAVLQSQPVYHASLYVMRLVIGGELGAIEPSR